MSISGLIPKTQSSTYSPYSLVSKSEPDRTDQFRFSPPVVPEHYSPIQDSQYRYCGSIPSVPHTTPDLNQSKSTSVLRLSQFKSPLIPH